MLFKKKQKRFAFFRCRLREKTDNGPGRIYLNDQMWKDITVPMGCTRELYLQALDKDDPIVDTESQTALIVRLSNGSLTEIVVDELTVRNLKAKVSPAGVSVIFFSFFVLSL